MSNISVKLNLSAFKHGISQVKGKSGISKKCIVIPIEDNGIIEGVKGMYFDMTGFEYKEKKTVNTHFLKQNFSKPEREAMTDEAYKALPFFGNMIDWSKTAQKHDEEYTDVEFQTNDDLPF